MGGDMTAEEHLREEVSRVISGYIFQLSIARAEIDRLKTALELKEKLDGATPARVSE